MMRGNCFWPLKSKVAKKVLDQTENIEEAFARKSDRHQARNQESVASYNDLFVARSRAGQ